MADGRVASRYVKALLGLAVDQGVLEPVHQDMISFDVICTRNRDLLNMLRSPIIRHEKKRNVLEKIFKGKVHPLTFSILDILTRKNRESLLLPIAREFHSAYNEYKGIGTATVTTAAPMDADLRAEIEAVVKQISNKKHIELVEKVNADLVGGFVLDVENRQVDASIKGKLKALKWKFSESTYVKAF